MRSELAIGHSLYIYTIFLFTDRNQKTVKNVFHCFVFFIFYSGLVCIFYATSATVVAGASATVAVTSVPTVVDGSIGMLGTPSCVAA